MASLLTLAAAAMLLGGGSSLFQEGTNAGECLAGIAMMAGGLLGFAGAFLLVLA